MISNDIMRHYYNMNKIKHKYLNTYNRNEKVVLCRVARRCRGASSALKRLYTAVRKGRAEDVRHLIGNYPT